VDRFGQKFFVFSDIYWRRCGIIGEKQKESLRLRMHRMEHREILMNNDNIRKLDLEAVVDNLPQVLEFVDTCLESADCPLPAQIQIDIAVEEIFVNIAKYAYDSGDGNVVVGAEVKNGKATISFSDSGIPYDPLAKEDPDVTLSAEERKIGGLGVFLVKNTMDDITYEYKDGQNILTLRKNF
jgi:anti-sigma regulatory factor (Ser/Thr protein kinase)